MPCAARPYTEKVQESHNFKTDREEIRDDDPSARNDPRLLLPQTAKLYNNISNFDICIRKPLMFDLSPYSVL